MSFMKTCCFCFDTKSGSIASGVYTMISKILAIVVITLILVNTKSVEDVFPAQVHQILSQVLNGVLIFFLVESVLFSVFCGMLIHGAWNDKPSFLIPWIVAMSVEVSFCVICFIAGIIIVALTPFMLTTAMVLTIFFMAFNSGIVIYMILCVESHRKMLLGQNYSRRSSVHASKM